MTSRLHRWIYLVGYVVLVAVSVSASWGYPRHVTHELDHHDQVSCHQRMVLAHNQADVLQALLKDRAQHGDRDEAQALQADLDGLAVALRRGC